VTKSFCTRSYSCVTARSGVNRLEQAGSFVAFANYVKLMVPMPRRSHLMFQDGATSCN
jgi:hypothetical protein